MGQSRLAEQITLCEALDRVLNKGVVLHGDITISVAGVDLLSIHLRALLSATDVIEADRQARLDQPLDGKEAA
jgi:hypothetical protein